MLNIFLVLAKTNRCFKKRLEFIPAFLFGYKMKKRTYFFITHISISILVAIILLAGIFYIWYPSPLAKAVGVTHIFLMLIAIDVIVGPLLGFLVYKEGKKSLKFDLIVIILLQISALGYGIYSIAQGRPAWLVYNVDCFELVRNNELFNQNKNEVKAQYRYPSWFGPQFAATQLALDIKQRNQETFSDIFEGISIAQRPERYVPLSQTNEKIKQRAQNLELLRQYNNKALIEKILAQYPKANAFVPLKANAVDMTVLVNKDTAEIIKIVDLRPWK